MFVNVYWILSNLVASSYCSLHILNISAAHRHSSVLIWQGWKLWPPICATNHSPPFPNRGFSLVESSGLRAVLPDFLSKHWEWAPPCSLKYPLAVGCQSRYLCHFSLAWSDPGMRRVNLEGANSSKTFQDWGICWGKIGDMWSWKGIMFPNQQGRPEANWGSVAGFPKLKTNLWRVFVKISTHLHRHKRMS